MDIPIELTTLVEYEKNAKYFIVNDVVKVSIVGNAKDILLNHRILEKTKVNLHITGLTFQGYLNRAFIHQVGNRIRWQENIAEFDYSLKEIYNNFFESLAIQRSFRQFEKHVETALMKHSIKIIYFDTIEPNVKAIYGIVSEHYEPSNQLLFREKFIKDCQENDFKINPLPIKAVKNKNTNRVEEYFKFNENENNSIQLYLGIVYGLNNGYGSYYSNWQRVIKRSNSALIPLEVKIEQTSNWRNNPKIIHRPENSINDFILEMVTFGEEHQRFLEKRMEEYKEIVYEYEAFVEMFKSILNRIKIADLSKPRVIEGWKKAFYDANLKEKDSLWAISESLIITATNESAIPHSMRELIRKAGSEIIDGGIDKFLKAYTVDNPMHISIGYDKEYGFDKIKN